MMTLRAVFLDRDGVVNQLLYVAEHGRVDTPLTSKHVRLIPGVAGGIKALQASGFRVILVSNQPGIAKGQFTPQVFEQICEAGRRLLQREGVRLDGEYYCLHHPHAARTAYRKVCTCRKPRPGLILKAARDARVNVGSSFMVGDGLTDVEAGRRAGCQTVLVGHISSLLTRIMERKQLYPTWIAEDFCEAVRWILEQGERERMSHDGRRQHLVAQGI